MAWFTFKEFYKRIAESNPDFKTFIELGLWDGESISFLANLVKDRENLELYGVDLFEDSYVDFYKELGGGHPIKRIYDVFLKRLDDERTRDFIKEIKGVSWEESKRFQDEYFDFIFIDADHAEESVRKDIISWYPKLKKGGIIAGHDFWESGVHIGVTHAVIGLIGEGNFENDYKQGVWWYRKVDNSKAPSLY